jgi:hypothetical protein
MKKERTIEEVRAKDRERQKKWREKNSVLHRERVLYPYAKSKYPQMVEARMKPETKAKYKVPEEPERYDHVTNDVKPVKTSPAPGESELSYDPDPEDARTPAEKALAAAYQNKARGGGTRVMEPEAKETPETRRVDSEVERFKAKRAAKELEQMEITL